MITITKNHRFDTMAIIRVTEATEYAKKRIKQWSTLPDGTFIREARINGELFTEFFRLKQHGQVKFEIMKTYHFQSEGEAQLRAEQQKLK